MLWYVASALYRQPHHLFLSSEIEDKHESRNNNNKEIQQPTLFSTDVSSKSFWGAA